MEGTVTEHFATCIRCGGWLDLTQFEPGELRHAHKTERECFAHMRAEFINGLRDLEEDLRAAFGFEGERSPGGKAEAPALPDGTPNDDDAATTKGV